MANMFTWKQRKDYKRWLITHAFCFSGFFFGIFFLWIFFGFLLRILVGAFLFTWNFPERLNFQKKTYKAYSGSLDRIRRSWTQTRVHNGFTSLDIVAISTKYFYWNRLRRQQIKVHQRKLIIVIFFEKSKVT